MVELAGGGSVINRATQPSLKCVIVSEVRRVVLGGRAKTDHMQTNTINKHQIPLRNSKC